MLADILSVPTAARSELFRTTDSTALMASVQSAAWACQSRPGYYWLTAQHVDDSDEHTVTSFWTDAGYVSGAAPELDGIVATAKAEWLHSDAFAVHAVTRIVPTEVGFRVNAFSLAIDPEREAEAITWATEAAAIAASTEGLSLAIVETAPGPRIVCVTTWRDEQSRQRGLAKLQSHYIATSAARWGTDSDQRVGTVTFTLAAQR